jgi:4-amino-4-deoxy-L-arabinose transferase-like glycosyltransferase
MSASAEQIRSDKKWDSKQLILVFIYLLTLSVVIRLPFFFDIRINWDESTAILMGQSIVDGHLPYTELWENKPPLLFLFFACTIALLGKSIVSVRIAGTLCVAVAALFTYVVGKTLWNQRTGILAATLFVILSSFFPYGQATMSEHIALVPLVGALSLLVTFRSNPRIYFFAGILMGIAVLVRTNLAYTATILGFPIVVGVFLEQTRSICYLVKCGLGYVSGICLVVLLTFLPYAVTDNSQIWWSSVVLAPMTWASSRLSFLDTLRKQIEPIWAAFPYIDGTLVGASIVLILGVLAFFVVFFLVWRKTPKTKWQALLLLIVFLFGTEVSILRSGVAHGHYFIQLAPFISLMVAAFLNACFSRHGRWVITGTVLLTVVISILSIIPQYKDIVSRALAGQELSHGVPFEIAAYLKREGATGEPIYMMDDHIVYWLIDAKPLSKSTTHPSTISKEVLLSFIVGPGTTTEQELARILAQKPKFIVTSKKDYLRHKARAKSLLEETLRTKYDLVKQIIDRKIYRRKR